MVAAILTNKYGPPIIFSAKGYNRHNSLNFICRGGFHQQFLSYNPTFLTTIRGRPRRPSLLPDIHFYLPDLSDFQSGLLESFTFPTLTSCFVL